MIQSYLQSNLEIRNCLKRNLLVLRNHFLWPNASLLHKDKEHLALRNNFRVTEKFLIDKFDCTTFTFICTCVIEVFSLEIISCRCELQEGNIRAFFLRTKIQLKVRFILEVCKKKVSNILTKLILFEFQTKHTTYFFNKYGTIHLRCRHFLRWEGSKIGWICRRIVFSKNLTMKRVGVKNGRCRRLKWMVPIFILFPWFRNLHQNIFIFHFQLWWNQVSMSSWITK